MLAAAIGVGIAFPNTGETFEEKLRPGGAAPEPPPKPVVPARVDASKALDVAAAFVMTAVARKNTARSYELVAPSLREGYTRAEWAKGDIPVQPFPVRAAKWQLDYSFENELGLKVALYPIRGSGVRATVFNLDLRAVGKGPNRRWLVESFMPGPVTGLGSAAGQPQSSLGLPDLGKRSTGPARLGAMWLAVPIALLSLAVIVPLAIGFFQWRRGVRAEKAYARSHG